MCAFWMDTNDIYWAYRKKKHLISFKAKLDIAITRILFYKI